MASADGSQSFIAPQFPPGTREVFVPAGTLLGYQGNWSGSPDRPTGIHLHFSVVKSTATGGYANETEIGNTYDPAPFLGVTLNEAGVLVCDGGAETGQSDVRSRGLTPRVSLEPADLLGFQARRLRTSFQTALEG